VGLPRLTLERTTLIVALALAFAIAVSPALDHDLWWHLRSGRWMVEHEAILRADPFSHTRASAIRQPSDWIAQLVFYATWATGGLTAVALLTAGLATAGTALILAACKGPALLRAAVVTLAAATSTVFWTARPQMFTFVLTAVVVLVLTRLRRHRGAGARRVWVLVPMFAVWSNLHLGWFYGLGVLWGTVAGELLQRVRRRPSDQAATPDALPLPAWRSLMGVAALSSLAVMVNPVGPRVYGLILTQVELGRRFIQENQPPSPRNPITLPFFLMLALTVLVLVVRRRRVSVTDALLVGGTALASLNAVRTVSLFATVAAPVLSHHAAALLDARRQARSSERVASSVSSGSPVANAAIVTVVVAVAVVTSAVRLAPDRVRAELRRKYPVAAVEWIRRARPPGPMFNTFDWGGYLIWTLPEYPVSIDGRADLYADHLPQYSRLLRGTGWEAEFALQGVRLALLNTNGPLTRAVETHPDWQMVYQDRLATVLVKQAR
jgi:hypothetical protein